MALLRITIECDSRNICDAHLDPEHLTTMLKASPALLEYLLEPPFDGKVEIITPNVPGTGLEEPKSDA